MKAKLNRVTEWFKQIRNKMSLKEIWNIFRAKLRGHVQYYGVSHNADQVNKFLHEATKIGFKWLNRRSQRKALTERSLNSILN